MVKSHVAKKASRPPWMVFEREVEVKRDVGQKKRRERNVDVKTKMTIQTAVMTAPALKTSNFGMVSALDGTSGTEKKRRPTTVIDVDLSTWRSEGPDCCLVAIRFNHRVNGYINGS